MTDWKAINNLIEKESAKYGYADRKEFRSYCVSYDVELSLEDTALYALDALSAFLSGKSQVLEMETI